MINLMFLFFISELLPPLQMSSRFDDTESDRELLKDTVVFYILILFSGFEFAPIETFLHYLFSNFGL